MIAVEAVGACVCLQHRSISHYHRTQVVQSPFAVSMYSTCLLQTSAASGIQTPSASTHSHRSTPHLVELGLIEGPPGRTVGLPFGRRVLNPPSSEPAWPPGAVASAAYA